MFDYVSGKDAKNAKFLDRMNRMQQNLLYNPADPVNPV
jgi:hypothetical protein